MKKLINILSLVLFVSMIFGQMIFSQQDLSDKNKDTLIIGGIYKIILDDGKMYIGELLSNKDSVIVMKIDNNNYVVRKNRIEAIEVPEAFNDEYPLDNLSEKLTETPVENHTELSSELPYSSYSKKKFNMIGTVQSGLALPTSEFKNIYSKSSGFQISAYKLFSRVTGLGIEFQYNNFHGRVYYNTNETYSYEKIETESYNSAMFKINYLVGDMRPEIDFVVYFLIGAGLQFNSEGQIKSTFVTHTASNTSTYNGFSGPIFIYGLGIGSFYKVNRTIGINLELQFDKVSAQSFYYTGANEYLVGFFSIKAGIVYTNF